MTINDMLLPEFDHEMGTTRRLLERVPDQCFAWKPHEKSMSLGRLATHVTEIPEWATSIIGGDEYNMETGPYEPRVAASRADLLEAFDKNCVAARARIAGRSDAELLVPWAFKVGGQTIFSMPKVEVLRGMMLNHLIHHRGQLSVYLRLQNVPLPGIYGPTADEPGQ